MILNVRGFEKAKNLKRDGHLARGEPILWSVKTLRSDEADVSYVTLGKLERGGFPKWKPRTRGSRPWRGESPGGYRASKLLNCGVDATDSQGESKP